MNEYYVGMDFGYPAEDSSTAVAYAIRNFWMEHADTLLPGTVGSSYGLADYLIARGLGPRGFRLSNPERLLSIWRHAKRLQEIEARRPRIGYTKDDGIFVEIDIKTLDPEVRQLAAEILEEHVRVSSYRMPGSIVGMRDFLATKGPK